MRTIGYLLGIPEQSRQLIRDTTNNAIGLTEGQFAVAADPELIPGAIEEVLRFEAPSPVQARYVAHDTECLGESIAEGSTMLLLNGSANRDEARFPNGERFDITAGVATSASARVCTSASVPR